MIAARCFRFSQTAHRGVAIAAVVENQTPEREREAMTHRASIGQTVQFKPPSRGSGASGTYTIVRLLPIENVAEIFERIAEETQLSRTG